MTGNIHLSDLKRSFRTEQDSFESFMSRNKDVYVNIWSGEHGAYWRSNRQGYTTHKEFAGIYSIKDAYDACGHCSDEKRIRFDILEKIKFNDHLAIGASAMAFKLGLAPEFNSAGLVFQREDDPGYSIIVSGIGDETMSHVAENGYIWRPTAIDLLKRLPHSWALYLCTEDNDTSDDMWVCEDMSKRNHEDSFLGPPGKFLGSTPVIAVFKAWLYAHTGLILDASQRSIF